MKTEIWAWEWQSEDSNSFWYRHTARFKNQRLAEDDMNSWLDRNGHRTARVVNVDEADKIPPAAVLLPMRPRVELLHPGVLDWMRRAREAMCGRNAIKFDSLVRECDDLIGAVDAN